jgi:hypothetical protein
MSDEQPLTHAEEGRLQQTEQSLDELQRCIDQARQKAERALKDVREHSSPPESMHVPEDLAKGPHRPGLG